MPPEVGPHDLVNFNVAVSHLFPSPWYRIWQEPKAIWSMHLLFLGQTVFWTTGGGGGRKIVAIFWPPFAHYKGDVLYNCMVCYKGLPFVFRISALDKVYFLHAHISRTGKGLKAIKDTSFAAHKMRVKDSYTFCDPQHLGMQMVHSCDMCKSHAFSNAQNAGTQVVHSLWRAKYRVMNTVFFCSVEDVSK